MILSVIGSHPRKKLLRERSRTVAYLIYFLMAFANTEALKQAWSQLKNWDMCAPIFLIYVFLHRETFIFYNMITWRTICSSDVRIKATTQSNSFTGNELWLFPFSFSFIIYFLKQLFSRSCLQNFAKFIRKLLWWSSSSKVTDRNLSKEVFIKGSFLWRLQSFVEQLLSRTTFGESFCFGGLPLHSFMKTLSTSFGSLNK